MRYVVAFCAAVGLVGAMVTILVFTLRPDDELGATIEWHADFSDPAEIEAAWNCPAQINMDSPDIPAVFLLHKPKPGPHPIAGSQDLLKVLLYQCDDEGCVEGPRNLGCVYGHGLVVGNWRLWLSLRHGLSASPADQPGRSEWELLTSSSHYIAEDGHYHQRTRAMYTCRDNSAACLFRLSVTEGIRPTGQD